MTDRQTTHAPGCCDRRLAVDELIERLRAVEWEETDDCGRMPDDPTHKCVFVDMRPDDFRALLREAAAALEAAREDAWQPIETAPKDGTRILLWIEWSDVPVVGEFRHGRWWADTEHYSVSCGAGCYGGSVSSDRYMKPTHWRPLPAPPAIDQARGRGGGGVILRGIVGLALLPVLVSLYVAGAVMGLLWIGVVAGWHSAGEVIDWIVGDTHTWKVTIQRVRLVPDSPAPPAPGHEREGGNGG